MRKPEPAALATILSLTLATVMCPMAAFAEAISKPQTPTTTEAANQYTSQDDTATNPSDEAGTSNTTPGTSEPQAEDEPDAQSADGSSPAVAADTNTYAHSATAEQNGVTFTVGWDDAPAGTATTFHVTQTGGSSSAKARMDVPTYWDTDGSSESVCDPTRSQWGSYYELGDNGHDFAFELTASGSYYINFYFMDAGSNVWYLRTTAIAEVSDEARPSVTQIVNNAVAQCYAETTGSEYDVALWLHDWTLDQLDYDHSLNWCSAESGLTRGQGTCESYQRIYAKLLNAAGIANGRMEGNGHTWNAVRTDGKWCQMDLTWDDTSDNWYGDLDQRHLYFGLTDELMAIAHSDHAANYQADGYAYRSTDLSNDYFVRNGKAGKWASAYADRIQQHLDAKETSFSIDADNGTFPPSISGIQNAIIAYAMNQREWSTADGSVTLAATSNVTTVSSYEWSAEFDSTASYEAAYSITAMPSDCEAPSGGEATFTIAAPNASAFQWQCSDNGGKSWYNTAIGAETSKQASLNFIANAQLAKRLYRCAVTFPDGTTLTSDPAHLTLATQYEIVAQPADCTATAGSVARFSVTSPHASTFQWQCSDNDRKSWYNTGIGGATSRQPTLEFTANAGLAKRLYRCLVTFPNGTTATSETARLRLSPNQIAEQLKDAVAATGSTATFTVKAQGATSYRWQCSDNEGETWYNTGIGNAAARQASLSFTANEALAKRIYRCIVTFEDGNETASQSATLTLAKQEGAIARQPQDCSARPGERATFAVGANRAASYQWQCSDNCGKTWYDTGIGGATSKTSFMSFTASEDLAKRLYRCMITYEGGAKEATSTAKLLLQ